MGSGIKELVRGHFLNINVLFMAKIVDELQNRFGIRGLDFKAVKHLIVVTDDFMDSPEFFVYLQTENGKLERMDGEVEKPRRCQGDFLKFCASVVMFLFLFAR